MSGLADIDDRQLALGHVALPPQGHGATTGGRAGHQPGKCGAASEKG